MRRAVLLFFVAAGCVHRAPPPCLTEPPPEEERMELLIPKGHDRASDCPDEYLECVRPDDAQRIARNLKRLRAYGRDAWQRCSSSK